MLGSSGWGIVEGGRVLDFNLAPQEAFRGLGERTFNGTSPGQLEQGTDPGRATAHHRRQHASTMNGKSRRERIASMSLAEREHEGQGHGARLRQREDELCAAIEQAAEAIKTGPVTDDDLMIALAVRDAQ